MNAGLDVDGVTMVVNFDLPYIVDTNAGNRIVDVDIET